MRKQFETMKEGYEKAIDRLGERIQQLETRPQPAAAAPAPPGPAAAPAAAQTAPAGPARDRGDPAGPGPAAPALRALRHRGPGQLLFDMGVAGDFIGNLTQNNVQQGQGRHVLRAARTTSSRARSSCRLFGQIDPYARAEVRVEAGEERPGRDRAAPRRGQPDPAGLPFNTQLKMGQMRNRFGLLNPIHEHDRPSSTRPNVLRCASSATRGSSSGAPSSRGWRPCPSSSRRWSASFNGDNEAAFGRGKLNEPLVTGRLRTFFELGDAGAIQLGASVANGETPERHRNTLLGFDAKYKYTPEGWQHPLLTVLGEMIYQIRRVNVLGRGHQRRRGAGHAGPDPRSATAGAGTRAARCSPSGPAG